MLKIETVLCRAGSMDNYAYILIDEDTGVSAVLDPSEVAPIVKRCESLNIKPNYIVNTHHHFDHTDGNLELKARYGCKVVGAKNDAHRIPGIDISVDDGEEFALGNSIAKIIEVNGHTQGHILWYFEKDKALFTGDTLFNLCVGGLFEGDAHQMWNSLKKINSLPDDVMFYPGHEYTMHGVSFANYIDGNNPDLIKYIQKAQEQTNKGLPCSPIALGIEKKCNPYLRCDDQKFAQGLGLQDFSPEEVFSKLMGM